MAAYVLLHHLGQPVRHHPHALVNVHLKGVFFLIQRLLPLMNDGGRILNLSSGLARFALPGYAAYAAMKGAVEVLSRYLAQELRPRGIARRHRPAGGRPAAARHTLVECAAHRELGWHVSVTARGRNSVAWSHLHCLRLWRLSNKRWQLLI